MFYAMPKEPPSVPQEPPEAAQGPPERNSGRPEGLKISLAAIQVLYKARSAKRLEHPTILWTKLVQTCGPV